MNIIIANDKGGVGKTLLAQYVISRLDQRGEAPRIAEFDRQPKLRRLYGENRVYSRPAFGDGSDGAAFDPLLKWLQVRRPLVLDLGAQAWSVFAAWARQSDLPVLFPGRETTILVPVTADLEAVEGGLTVLRSVQAVLPEANLVILPCDKDGAVETLADIPAWQELAQLAARQGALLRRFPVLRAEGWPLFAARGFTLATILAGTPASMSSKALPPTATARSLKGLRAWMEEMDAALGAFLPEPAAVAVSSMSGGSLLERL